MDTVWNQELHPHGEGEQSGRICDPAAPLSLPLSSCWGENGTFPPASCFLSLPRFQLIPLGFGKGQEWGSLCSFASPASAAASEHQSGDGQCQALEPRSEPEAKPPKRGKGLESKKTPSAGGAQLWQSPGRQNLPGKNRRDRARRQILNMLWCHQIPEWFGLGRTSKPIPF